ncbi:hypothetical protein [Deinococcus sp.]|uniref:hypothetical protein n=1 Tax=Deinococcus sp. TaxID=47478 RepID=UPI0025C0E009|nr:hypothetical protein [Deinococcus sp.]
MRDSLPAAPFLPRPQLLLGAALGYAAYLQNPRDPLRPTDLPDGVGPVTHRLYRADVQGATLDAAAVTALVGQRLPDLAPKFTAWFRGLDAPLPSRGGPPIRPGTRLRILLTLTRRARVQVQVMEPTRLRLRTLRLHADAGTVTFRAQDTGPGGLRLEIETVVRAASWPDRAAYLLAAHLFQRLNWEAVLTGAARLGGGQVTARDHRTREYAYVPPAAR